MCLTLVSRHWHHDHGLLQLAFLPDKLDRLINNSLVGRWHRLDHVRCGTVTSGVAKINTSLAFCFLLPTLRRKGDTEENPADFFFLPRGGGGWREIPRPPLESQHTSDRVKVTRVRLGLAPPLPPSRRPS